MTRVQVTIDPELADALAEFGGGAAQSRTVRNLAVRGAEALRQEREAHRAAIAHLVRIARGEDDRYDLGAAETAHRERP